VSSDVLEERCSVSATRAKAESCVSLPATFQGLPASEGGVSMVTFGCDPTSTSTAEASGQHVHMPQLGKAPGKSADARLTFGFDLPAQTSEDCGALPMKPQCNITGLAFGCDDVPANSVGCGSSVPPQDSPQSAVPRVTFGFEPSVTGQASSGDCVDLPLSYPSSAHHNTSGLSFGFGKSALEQGDQSRLCFGTVSRFGNCTFCTDMSCLSCMIACKVRIEAQNQNQS